MLVFLSSLRSTVSFLRAFRTRDKRPPLLLAGTYIHTCPTQTSERQSPARASLGIRNRGVVSGPLKRTCVCISHTRVGACACCCDWPLVQRKQVSSKPFQLGANKRTYPTDADIMLWKQVRQYRGEKSRCRSIILFFLISFTFSDCSMHTPLAWSRHTTSDAASFSFLLR
ncbi:hypothetical protein BJ166DRAFT_206539 [Pestalotiopsis sp. NC0098]|nr:hypothetical protein BJ166DRAFT_206539 [Pestalotiopsis sp. NC0098]